MDATKACTAVPNNVKQPCTGYSAAEIDIAEAHCSLLKEESFSTCHGTVDPKVRGFTSTIPRFPMSLSVINSTLSFRNLSSGV